MGMAENILKAAKWFPYTILVWHLLKLTNIFILEELLVWNGTEVAKWRFISEAETIGYNIRFSFW